jgi:MFS transporter, ACS family, D-galactonate transporter
VRWRILPLMMVFVALAQFNRVSMAVTGTEQIIPAGLLSETEMGVVYSAYLLPYTLFMIPGGWFIDRFGPRVAWVVAGLGAAVFVALTGVAGLVWTEAVALWVGLLLVRGLLGIAYAPLHPTGARLVANWIPRSKANLANGLVTWSATIGMASSYVVFGFLIDRLNWPGAFLFSAGVTLVLTLAWMALAADHPPGAAGTTTANRPASPTLDQVGQLLKDRNLRCLTLSYALIGYFQYLFVYWSEYYFETVKGLPKETSRLYSAILTLVWGAGMVLGGWLSDRALSRFGLRRGLGVIPVCGLLLSTAAVVIGVRAPTPEATLAWLALANGAVGLSEGSYWTAAVQVGGARGGTAAGILNTGGNAGGLLAPVLTPLLGKHFGWGVAVGVSSVVCLLGAALWLPVCLEPAHGETSPTREQG